MLPLPQLQRGTLARTVRVTTQCVVFGALVTACARGSSPTFLARAAEKRGSPVFPTVDLAYLRSVTESLTAAPMEGRGLGSAGGMRAATFLARMFAVVGATSPAASPHFTQQVALWTLRMDTASTFVETGTHRLRVGDDFSILNASTPTNTSIAGRVVYVGFGLEDSATARHHLTGVDLRGAIVVVSSRRVVPPDEQAPPTWSAVISAERALSQIVKQHVAAVLMVDDERADVSAQRMRNEHVEVVPLNDTVSRSVSCPILRISAASAERIFADVGRSYAQARSAASEVAFSPRELHASVRVNIRTAAVPGEAVNVVAMIPGSDPVLSRHAVVFMAHYDALGRDRTGAVRVGAADNALGVGMLMSIAKRLVALPTPPRRTILFLATTGEERGMLGARFWADHPTVPVDSLSAVLNIDGIGTEVFGPVARVVGFGADLSTLGDVLTETTQALGVANEEDPFAAQRPFYRSDHIVFARRGVPALMLLGLPADSVTRSLRRTFAWVERAYHAPGDTISPDWDWRGPRDLASIVMAIGLRVANADAEPTWQSSSPFQRRPTAP
jgi:Peptidase family M28